MQLQIAMIVRLSLLYGSVGQNILMLALFSTAHPASVCQSYTAKPESIKPAQYVLLISSTSVAIQGSQTNFLAFSTKTCLVMVMRTSLSVMAVRPGLSHVFGCLLTSGLHLRVDVQELS